MTKKMRLILISVITSLVVSACYLKSDPKVVEEDGFSPRRDIEFVIPSSAGGGSDLNARLIAEIAVNEGFVNKEIMVINMVGDSGGVAYKDVFRKKGRNETLMVLHNGQIMSTMINGSPVTSDMLTYLQVLAFDKLLLAVSSDSQYQRIDDFLERAKRPERIVVGGSQIGNTDHLAFELMNKYTQAEASYLSFDGSADVMKALLKGHVSLGIFNPSDCIDEFKNGDIIPLATFSKDRISGDFAHVPSFVELGYDQIQIEVVRALAGPPEMSEEAIGYYDEVLKKVSQTQQWEKEYIEPNYLESAYMKAAEAKIYFEKEIEKYKILFKDLELIE